MALITCPECGAKISDQAKTCIHCGYPISDTDSIDNSQEEKKTENNDEPFKRFTIVDTSGLTMQWQGKYLTITDRNGYDLLSAPLEDITVTSYSKANHQDNGFIKLSAYGRDAESFIFKSKEDSELAFEVLNDRVDASAADRFKAQYVNSISKRNNDDKGTKPKKKHGCLTAIIVIIVLLILTSVAASLGKKETLDQANKTEGATNEIEQKMQTQESDAETKKVVETEAPEIAIDEQVIYDDNNVVITTKGLEKTVTGYDLKLFIENNSALNLGFNAHAYGINGIMMQNNIYDMDTDVAAGKKANATLSIHNTDLSFYGIEDIRCIDINFWAYDNDKYFKEFETGQIEIPTNLYTGDHDMYTAINLYDQDGISIDALPDPDNGNYAFIINNETDDYFDMDFSEISINDYTVTDVDYDLIGLELLKSCQVICFVIPDNTFLNENAIDEIDTIEFNLEIRPQGDYYESKKIGPIVLDLKTIN